MRAPQGCLRVWVRRIQPTVREQVNLHRRLGSYPAYLSTPRRPSSHPRGFRLIHLSKSCVTKVLRRQPLQVRRRSTFFPAAGSALAFAFAFPTGGGGSYRPFRPCQSAASKIFVQPSRRPDRPATNRRNSTGTGSRQPVEGPFVSPRRYIHTPWRTGRFAASLVLFKRCCESQQATREPTNAAVQSPRQVPCRWRE